MALSKALLEAIAVTAELTGTQLSEPAARVMAAELSAYPEAQILGALTRCRRELRGRLTMAEVTTRIDDGRPGPEEAWAMIPKDEAGSIVWTREMAEAYGIAAGLLDAPVQARMAFLESYRERVRQARERNEAPKWTPSLGHDPRSREAAISEAVRLNRLAPARAVLLLPSCSTLALDQLEAMAPKHLVAA